MSELIMKKTGYCKLFFIEADEHGISLSEEPEVRRC